MPNLYVAVVRRTEPISGVAIQPEYHVGPYSESRITRLETRLEGTSYYVDEVIPLIDEDELNALI